MLNQIVIVGRLVSKPKLKENEMGHKYSNFTIAVPRSFKNQDGVYETDFIDVTTFNNIAEQTTNWIDKGDLIGIRGRLQTSTYEDKDGNKRKTTDVIAEKVTFLSSKKEEKKEG